MLWTLLFDLRFQCYAFSFSLPHVPWYYKYHPTIHITISILFNLSPTDVVCLILLSWWTYGSCCQELTPICNLPRKAQCYPKSATTIAQTKSEKRPRVPNPRLLAYASDWGRRIAPERTLARTRKFRTRACGPSHYT
jgi:hypothetical protein